MDTADLKKLGEAFHTAIAEICPIDGIAIGDPEDKNTWRIDFRPEATQGQRHAAQQAFQSFDPNAV